MIKKLKLIALTAICSLSLVACSSDSSSDNTTEDGVLKNLPTATITYKDFGKVEVELYPHIAANTVNNFVSLAQDGFYDGLTMHRIIPDFMIQGGDPSGNGTGGPDYSIAGEFSSNGFENELKHTVGVISMARSSAPDSAGSQFFIMTEDYPSLDGQYAAFGKVISGLDVVEAIEAVETDEYDLPKTPVVIESIEVELNDLKFTEPEVIK